MNALLFFSRKLARIESPIERQLFIAFWHAGISAAIQCQVQVGRYRLDFAVCKYKLAIECDGHEYHKTKEQRRHDAEKDRFLLADGWRVARFTGSEIVKDASACAEEVRVLVESLKARGAAVPVKELIRIYTNA